MRLFNVFKKTIFLKETSDLEKQLKELKNLNNKNSNKDIMNLKSGIKGEKSIEHELKSANLGLYVLKDITLEFEENKVQIDYVVISKGYTYLIECKNITGNIYVDSSGQFQIDTKNGNKIAIYSPYRQAKKHTEILKKIWYSERSEIDIAFREKYFDELWYKTLVVFTNCKSILNTENAPKEIKNNTIRADQLIDYIKKDLSKYNKFLLIKQKEMLEIANMFLKYNTNKHNSFANKYNKNNLIKDKELLNKLKEFRKEKSKEMNIPAYYIFTDKELKKIIQMKPKTLDDLKLILPLIKVKVHGENIIKICQHYNISVEELMGEINFQK